jgi:filamentous hemagglutinin family protein
MEKNMKPIAQSSRKHTRCTSGAACETRPGGPHIALKTLTVSLMMAFGAHAFALPVGGVVADGSAGISSTAGSTTITQSSQNVAINWQSFNIGVGEAVRFIQPDSSSVALNRVLGPDPSSILGSLSANGKVFLVNPGGILFGHGAQVNVGGLVASTLAISDSDFMAGRYLFAGDSKAAVLNQGTINAPGGHVALLGANVGNDGIILARMGTVALAAGSAVTLDVAGDGLLNVTVSQGAVNALAQNGGLIQADGGQVLLTATAAGSLLQSAVNNTGLIQAQSIENHTGTIRLQGDMQTGTVNVGGTLDVSGTASGQSGGRVIATGHHIGLFGADIIASGHTGGGTVLIGGDYQGTNPAVPNASATYMSADSTIAADAIANGNGGKVILWSDESTRAYGSITARGGALGGNGGLIETSGHWLDVFGILVNASAPNGKAGTWLLDPADITITAGTIGATLAGGVYSPDSSVGVATVDVGTLQTALGVGAAGTDITITTTNTGATGVPPSGLGNITIASAITWSPTTPTTLTLNAAGDVNINFAVSATGGNFVVCCGRDINVNAPISTTTPGGSVLLAAGNNLNVNAAISVTSGNITMCAGNNVTLMGAAAAITLVDIAPSPGLSLGLENGLVLSAGNNGTGVGTLIYAAGTPPVAITRAPVNIYYNPVSYVAPTDYSTGAFFTLVGPGSPLTQFMLVYPEVAAKTFDGTTTAAFTGALTGLPPGVTLALPGTANFDTAAIGANKTVTFTGATLAQGPTVTGGAGINYAFTNPCCGPAVARTTGTVIAALPVIPPVPPVVTTDVFPEEMLGVEEEGVTPAESLLLVPSLMPRPKLAALPPQLLTVAPPPVPVVVPPPPVAQEPRPIFVPPLRPRKQDRN